MGHFRAWIVLAVEFNVRCSWLSQCSLGGTVHKKCQCCVGTNELGAEWDCDGLVSKRVRDWSGSRGDRGGSRERSRGLSPLMEMRGCVKDGRCDWLPDCPCLQPPKSACCVCVCVCVCACVRVFFSRFGIRPCPTRSDSVCPPDKFLMHPTQTNVSSSLKQTVGSARIHTSTHAHTLFSPSRTPVVFPKLWTKGNLTF